MVAYFYSLSWQAHQAKWEDSFGEIPRNALKDRRGEYCTRFMNERKQFLCRKHNELELTVQTEDGKLYTEDISSYVKYVKNNIRITKNIREKLEIGICQSMFEVETNVDKGTYIIKGIYDAIEKAF